MKSDANYDLYYYDFCGYAGTFIYTPNWNSITKLTADDCVIKPQRTSNADFSFLIITPDGVRYYFTEKELVTQTGGGGSLDIPSYEYTAITSWHLSKMVSANHTDSIQFTYTNAPSWSEDKKYSCRSKTGTYNTSDFNVKFTYSTGQIAPKYTTTHRNVKIPKSIEFSEGRILFTDTLRSSSTLNRRISRIDVYNKPGKLIRRAILKGGASVEIIEDGKLYDKYTFSYYNSPGSNSGFYYDLFGYSNGKDGTTLSVLNDDLTLRDSRKFSFEYARGGCLKQVVQLSGAITQFDYEPNEVKQIINKCLTPIHIGIRVKAITVTDPINEQVRVRRFTYENACSNIDFSKLEPGVFISQTGTVLGDGFQINTFSDLTVILTNTFSQGSLLPGSNIENAVAYYGRVTETVSDEAGGNSLKVVYEYDTSRFPDHCTLSGPRPSEMPGVNTWKPQPDTGGGGIGGGGSNFISYFYLNDFKGKFGDNDVNTWLFASKLVGYYYMQSFYSKTDLLNKFVYSWENGSYRLVEETHHSYSADKDDQILTGFYWAPRVYSDWRSSGKYWFRNAKSEFLFYDVYAVSKHFTLDSTTVIRHYAGLPSSKQVTSYTYNFNHHKSPKSKVGALPPVVKPDPEAISRRPNYLLASVKTQVGKESYQEYYYYLAGMYFKDEGIKAISLGWESAPVLRQLVVNNKDTLSLRLQYRNLSSGLQPVQRTLLHNRDTVEYYLCSRYDNTGNLQEISRNGLAPTSYLWKTGNLYPDAVIQGMGIDSVLYIQGIFPGSNRIREKRPHTLVTDYSYIPLVGISNTVSPSYRRNNYTYAGTRMSSALDGFKSKLVSYEYSNYAYMESPGYVRTLTYQDEQGSKYQAGTTYVDGLGRPFRTVLEKYCPDNATNLVTYTQYDAFDRQLRQWLPVPLTGNGALLDHDGFVNASKAYYKENCAYAENRYEQSALSRLLAVQGPGESFSGHLAQTAYLTNYSNALLQCTRYQLSGDDQLRTAGLYAGGVLEVTRHTDEDGNDFYTFTDFMGRVVLERRIGNSNEQHDTYYVYDNLGKKRFVLPPSAVDGLRGTGPSWSIRSNKTLQDYAYFYRYDSKDRLVEMKKPGADPVYYLYDKAGQCIFTQDGNQRSSNRWSFTIPDLHGRTALTGWCTGTTTNLGNAIKNTIVTARYDTRTPGVGSSGYTLSGVTFTGSSRVLAVNYYDDYSFLNLYPAHKASLTYQYTGYGTVFTGYPAGLGLPLGVYSTPYAGLLTGTYTAMAADGDKASILSAMYYDERERLVQQLSTNHLGGYEKEYYLYTFTGKPLKYSHQHTVPDQQSHSQIYTYTYDHAERLKTVLHQLDTSMPVPLVENQYDQLGRLTGKKCHGNASLATSYAYNIRGWVTDISGTHFTQNLTYNAIPAPVVGIKRYNGNISTMTWKTSKDAFSRKYVYYYDKLDRLLMANYSQSNSTNASAYNTSYTYNKMGSITRLQRKGSSFLGPNMPVQIDDLTLLYNGNQLRKVDDAASVNDPMNVDAMNFYDVAKEATEYYYDKNGNMTGDLNKEITQIKYNLLNLPSKVSFEDGKWLDVVYDANGVKRSVSFSTPVTLQPIYPGTIGGKSMAAPVPTLPPSTGIQYLANTTTTDYCGNFIYEEGKLSMILTSEGYITLSGAIPTYHYYLKDYLGNNRVVAKQNRVVEEVNHYYPFGALFNEYLSASKHPYKFGGKELNRMHGLDLYDFTGRTMNPVVPGFTTMDPLCEKYYAWTPYGYCMGNPIRYVDPDGRQVYVTGPLCTEAVKQLQDKVGSSMVLSMDDNGKLSYTLNSKDIESDAARIMEAINDESITVNINAINGCFASQGGFFCGGAFMGNRVIRDMNNNVKVIASQEVNPNTLGQIDYIFGTAGEGMMHEVTEAYVGAKMSKTLGISSGSSKSITNFYAESHFSATPQPGLVIRQTWYDRNGNITTNVQQTASVEWTIRFGN